MTSNQDARPITDLRKDVEEFQTKIGDDVNVVIDFLDRKITALICDPDSLGNSTRPVKQNPLVEFSKAKFEIFMNIKSLFNQKEQEWIDYISEMKKLFLENVEIFLAGTKLEVKLPSSEFESSDGARKSPGNRKARSSVASAVYPIINNIARNIPVLGSTRQSKESSDVGGNVQSNRSNRLSIKLNNPPSSISVYQVDSSDSSENEATTSKDIHDIEMKSGETSRELNASKLESRLCYNSEREVREAWHLSFQEAALKQGELEAKEFHLKMGIKKNRKGRPKKTAQKTKSALPSQNGASEDSENKSAPKPRRGRSKQTAENTEFELPSKNSASEDSESKSVPETRRGRSKQTAQDAQFVDFQKSNSSSEETEVKRNEASGNHVKSRRGKQNVKDEVNNSTEKETTVENDAANEEESNTETKSIKNRSRGRSAAPKNSVSDARKSIRSRRNAKTVNETYEPGPSKSFKKVGSLVAVAREIDISDDADIAGLPAAVPSRSTTRRKTIVFNLGDSDIIPESLNQSKPKRKTMSGLAEFESAAPSKRLKIGSQSSSIQEEMDVNDNLLESDDNYSEWMALKNVDGKIPTVPAIYEVKVWRAKKSAYIGSCESLRQKLTLYKLRQNSGHKHLDKFIERNYDDIQIRFEAVPSVESAKQEVKNRINSFVAQYKTTPAYN